MPCVDQLRQVPVDERQQQRRDVIAVRVGVGEDDDLAVAQPATARSSCRGRSRAPSPDPTAPCSRAPSPATRSRCSAPCRAAAGSPAARDRVPAWPIRRPNRPRRRTARCPRCAGLRAVAQLAGQVQARRRRALARDLGLRGAARLARARRQDDARDDRLGDADVVIQPVLERRPHDAVDRRQQLRVVQPILRLALELRLLDEDAEDAGQPFADVLGRERRRPSATGCASR